MTGGHTGWGAREAGGGREGVEGADYLYELGASSNVSTNVDVGQTEQFIDSLFVSKEKRADIADGSLRNYNVRKLNNIQGDYYICPRFLDTVALHMAKNHMTEYLPQMNCPLMLGIWGGKGQGKSFQVELCLKKMGVEPVVISAGELESELAGQCAKEIRNRYREASEAARVRGEMGCLIINDIDAGAGNFKNTQMTVNTQMVMGTLMNICDDPNSVAVESIFSNKKNSVNRCPIIVTGNDFSKLYAPLLRDGRMEKYYWDPTEDDIVEILLQMFKDDGFSRREMLTFRRAFPEQALDFFGAVRAATVDREVKKWVLGTMGHSYGELSRRGLGLDFSELQEKACHSMGSRLLDRRLGPVTLDVDKVTVDDLLREGRRLELEQEHVMQQKLSEEYMRTQEGAGTLVGLQG